MCGDEVTLNHPLEASLETWPDAFDGRHKIDCR
jgi:hypothetical protein